MVTENKPEIMDACSDCGGTDEVINGLCEDCEQHYVFCAICNEFIHEDSAMSHRHLWWDDEIGDWSGPGVDLHPLRIEKIKQSFFAVLKKTRIASDLERTIDLNEMGFDAIHFQGTIFGYTSIWCCLRGEDIPGRRINNVYCGDRFTADLTEEEEDAMGDGISWLIALDNEKTPEANAITLTWLQEFQEIHPDSTLAFSTRTFDVALQ